MSKTVSMTPGPVKVNIMEEGDIQQFTPSNTGTEGQVLIKTENGYEWGDVSGASNYHTSTSTFNGSSATLTSSVEVVQGENNSSSSGGSGGEEPYVPIYN